MLITAHLHVGMVQTRSHARMDGCVLTGAAPHLGQVAVRLPRLLAQLHHVPAERVRGDGNLSKMLVIVTEVYSQEHLQTERGRERERCKNNTG